MLNWIAKKMLGSELQTDLRALSSLPAISRLKTALGIVQVIEKGLDLLDQGTPLLQVQKWYQQARRQAVSQASGYDDPTHLLASIPDHFFGSLSDAYRDAERASVCRMIVDAIKAIIQQDGSAVFSKEDSKGLQHTYAEFEKRLIQKQFI